jgi:predicted alpha/beta hydrolase
MTDPESIALECPRAPLAPLSLWRAPMGTERVVLVLPALGTPARVYRRLAAALRDGGEHTAVLELRGQGESLLRALPGVDWGYADLVDDEVATAVSTLAATFPRARIVLLGHSLGAHLALLHRARDLGPAVAGIAIIAAGAPYWRAYPWPMSWVTRVFGAVVAFATRMSGYFPGHRLGFGGDQGATLMREWGAFLAHGRLAVTGWRGTDSTALLAASDGPLLALTLAGDHYAPPSATRHLIGLTRSKAQPERVAYPGKPGHFGWLKEPAPVAARVLAFVRALAQ